MKCSLKKLAGGLIVALTFLSVNFSTHALAADDAIRGTVAETMNSGGYTYVLLDQKTGKEWFAVPESLVQVGDEIQLMPGIQMGPYTSPTLQRTFEKITFSGGITGMLKRVVKTAEEKATTPQSVNIAKAAGENSYTVAEIFEKKDSLNGKKVTVRGKVVKSSQFDGLQWLRIVDGSGSSKRGNHKLIVTTAKAADQDEIITATGTVTTGKAFGALTYEVIVENAEITKQTK
ncbi:MAG: hypothetical protein PHI06_11660 [Desulfobulbaceae bacterium]|nr:hypothetical protein [Desulfobulbaceae bacterium]